MLPNQEPYLAYFISITHCSREKAIEILDKSNWKVDIALNVFFEEDSKPSNHTPSKSISSPGRIIIPGMIAFQRFLETSNPETNIYLENSSKMMHLTMVYATSRPSNISSDNLEHWQLHVKIDYTRLQTLLDNDLCAPLVWIEHFEHLLNGNLCQLFDCDHLFNVIDN